MSPRDYPEPPDPKRLAEVRGQLDREQARRRAEQLGANRRFGRRIDGEQLRNIGTYTLIPMVLLAGPMVGYGLGWLVEHFWGCTPWGTVTGMLIGMVAGFRQVFLILAKKTAPPNDRGTGNGK